jgi:hypoxia up-regulated 1
LFGSAASAVIGIDFGTEYIKAALVKPGIPLEIVLTKDSRRKELSAVAFKPLKNAPAGSFPERLYGSDAVALTARFPGDVYPNLRAILGLPVDDPRVTEYSTRYPSLVLEAEKTRGTVEFRSAAFTPEEDAWMVEELLAMELQSIQKNAEALAGKGSSIRDIVITVPPYFDMEEKRAIELAADLAGLRVLSLISDGLAVGLNYATSRTFPSVADGGKPEHHLVFDMGAGSTKATLLKFQGRTVKDGRKSNKTIQEVQVLGAGWDRTLGGDALNALIVSDMVAKFVESKAAKKASVTTESVLGQGRATAMLWKQAERLRQVLSANTETSANFEGLYDDIDFRYKLTRANFEDFASAHADRVYPAVKMALDRAGLEISDIDSIILHGGATRTPFVQKELEKLVGNGDKLRSNVNADEAAVFGAAFRGAGLSPSFRVKDIKTYEAAGYAVGMKWTNINLKPQKQRLYTSQSHLGVEKVVSFQNLEDFDIHFYQYVDTAGNGVFSNEREVLKLATKNLTDTVAELKEKHGCTSTDIVTKFGVRLSSENGEVEITKAAVQCEVEQDDKKGSVVDGVKGLFGFGSKKSDQDIFQGSDIVSDAESSSESSSTTATSTSTKGSSSSSPSASASATEEKPKGKRLIAISLDFTVEKSGYPALPAKVLSKKKDRLVAFDDSDHARRLREESLNQLEAFTYRVREKLEDGSFIEASTEVERVALGKLSEAASEWIYGEGAEATREAFREKLKELRALVSPIEKRKDEAAKRPEQIKLLKDALDSAKSIIETVKERIKKQADELSSALLSSTTSTASTDSSTETDEFFEEESTSSTSTTSSEDSQPTLPPSSFTEEDLKVVVDLYQEVSNWLEEKLALQEKLTLTDEPILLVKEIAQRANELSKASMDMIMKGMKAPEMPKMSSSKTSKTKKPKTAKTKKAKTTTSTESSATTSADAPRETVDAEFYEPPTEQQILEELENLAEEKLPEETHKKDEL